jgi:phage terminase large subunit-like protein
VRENCNGRPHDNWTWNHARADQHPPKDWGDAYVWLALAGRGAGKTRSGSEWTHRYARANPGCYIGLVAPTTSDARDVIVEGNSGILATAHPAFRPEWEPSKRRLTWPNGSTATTFSDDTPERLRGPQHHALWFDELAAYKNLDTTWSNALFGLRLGQHPKVLITTTPKPLKFLRDLVADEQTIVRTASTYDNLDNLARTYRDTVIARYAGTALGEQELHAQILDDNFGEALWVPGDLRNDQDMPIPATELGWHVIAVDPGVTTGGDATGIVVMAATGEREPQRRRGVVLADITMVKASPEQWSQRIVNTYHALPQPCIVIAESNQGGELVSTVIHQIDPTVPVSLVHSHKSKEVRADPVVMAYRMHRVVHVPGLTDLEGEMTGWIPGISKESPNRIDALVHGMTALLINSNALRTYGAVRRASTSTRGFYSAEGITARSASLADLQARRETRWGRRPKTAGAAQTEQASTG